MNGLWNFIFLGVAFHLVAIFTIFDIYFRSPLTHGMKPIDPPVKPKAKRVIIIIGKFF